jgi:hypothetical protein
MQVSRFMCAETNVRMGPPKRSHRGRKIVARCSGGDPLWQGVARGRVRDERFWALLASVGGEAVCRRQAKLPDRRAELSSRPPRLPRHGLKVPRARCAASPTLAGN